MELLACGDVGSALEQKQSKKLRNWIQGLLKVGMWDLKYNFLKINCRHE